MIQRLIDAGIITKNDIDEYNKQNATGLIKQQAEELKAGKPKQMHSVINKGVIVRFDERDLNESGEYITPSCVHTIGRFAFTGAKNVKKVILSPDVKHVLEYAFSNCGGLISIDLGNVNTIGDYAFLSCMQLQKVKTSNKLKRVGKSVFYDCISLESIDIIDVSNNYFANNAKAQRALESKVKGVTR